ncbi:MAG: sulfatase-like hydrolase/transferase [Planctomycetota bacterium]
MKKQPNMILFMPETLRADAVFGLAERRARTPVLDELAKQSVTFQNTFVNHSVCTPSRCSMFTGFYPHTCGHRTLDYLLKPYENNLFRDLKENGYTTVCFGKNDILSPESVSKSFDSIELLVWPDTPSAENPWPEDHKFYKTFYYGERPAKYSKDYDWACIESALKFLDNPPEPFCLFLPLSFVHPPYYVEEPYFSMHDRSKVPKPIRPEHEGRRRYARLMYERYGLKNLEEKDFREIKATYFGMVSRIDQMLGLVLDRLKQTKLFDKTAIVVFSDHGDYTGDYGLVEKWWTGFEEPIIHTPLIIRVPGQEVSINRNCLIEMVDLYPTILNIAGVKPSHYYFGKSVLPLLDADHPDVHRNAVFCEGGHNPDERHCREPLLENIYYEKTHLPEYDPVVISKAIMVRTGRYKYIYCPDEHDELYDLQADPDELRNLVSQEQLIGIAAELKSEILEWLTRTADTVPLEKDPRKFQRTRKLNL